MLVKWVSIEDREEHWKAHMLAGGIYNGNPIALQYRLVRREMTWTRETPEGALDATALVQETELPDTFWIAEYVVRRAATWDPIIYAEYGAWQVEVYRWD